jgi:hypothetical protein
VGAGEQLNAATSPTWRTPRNGCTSWSVSLGETELGPRLPDPGANFGPRHRLSGTRGMRFAARVATGTAPVLDRIFL